MPWSHPRRWPTEPHCAAACYLAVEECCDVKPIPLQALLLLALIALFWGLNWPLLKVALNEAPVFWFRMVCAWGCAAGLGMVARLGGQSLTLARGERVRLAWVALFTVVGWNAFSGLGVLLLPAGRAAMLGYTMPLWVALLSFWLLDEKPNRVNLAALTLGLAGVALSDRRGRRGLYPRAAGGAVHAGRSSQLGLRRGADQATPVCAGAHGPDGLR